MLERQFSKTRNLEKVDFENRKLNSDPLYPRLIITLYLDSLGKEGIQ